MVYIIESVTQWMRTDKKPGESGGDGKGKSWLESVILIVLFLLSGIICREKARRHQPAVKKEDKK